MVCGESISFRGLFYIIIDDKGILLHQITVNNLPVGYYVEKTMRLNQSLQFTDKNGEVYPPGWKSGNDTFKSDV